MDSNFRAFWLAPVTWNILGYSPFCERREKWCVASQKFQKKKLWPLMKQHSFYPSDLVNTKTTRYPPQGRWRVVDIYLDASRLGIYPPLFTSPSGDSCIIYIYNPPQLICAGYHEIKLITWYKIGWWLSDNICHLIWYSSSDLISNK